MTQGYQPFVIRVGEQTGNTYPVTAEFQGASWSGAIPAELSLLTKGEIQQARGWLERGFIDRDYAKDFGSRLFQTLFPDSIREGFRVAYERVAPQDGLRIILTLPPALAGLPWELMYDEEGGHGFLARSASAPLVRHFTGMPLPHEPPEEGPLRILIVTASPQNYPALSSEQEAKEIGTSLARRRMGLREALRLLARHLLRPRALRDLLRRLRHRGLVEIEVLSHATRQSLQRHMVEARSAGRGYHVVHFVGHGYADEGASQLILETENGRADPVPADEFAEMIAEPTVNLAVLNACQTASAASLFRGVAQATLRRGVPAVIGMQLPVLDRAAVEFAREFYGAWAAGQPIEAALAYARRLIRKETPGAAADWGIPVLFMGPIEGLRLRLGAPPIRWPWPVRGLRGAVALFLSLLSTVGLLLTIPDINRQVRTQVPVIRCAFPYPMESAFNVAVVDFTVLDENGSPVRSSDGRALADFLFQRLEFTFDELNLGMPYEIRPPAQICPIKGRTKEEREDAAAALAEHMDADVIIYGVITCPSAGNKSRFALEFYVNFEGFEQGEEIVGRHALGSELPLPRPFDPGKLPQDLAPSERIKALSLITIGLSHYATDELEKALVYFRQAEMTRGWSPTDGSKAVVYLLLGNASGRLASMTKDTEYLTTARGYYSDALSIDPTYARAKVGEASALYLMAMGDPIAPSFDAVNWDQLDEAAAAFEAALALENVPESANIETKVHFYLGQLDIVRAQGLGGEWLARAEHELGQVVEEYESGNARVEDWAGHAYARLGLIAWLQGDTSSAVEHIKKAIKHVSPYYQADYCTWLAEAYVAAGQTDLAMEAYKEAIDTAVFYGFQENAEKYNEKLKKLQAGEE